MIYAASLVELTDDKLAGHVPIKTKEELDKIVAMVSSSNRVIIRKDFAGAYFTPASLVSYVQNCKLVNSNLIIELDKDTRKYNVNDFFEKMIKADNADELVSLIIRNEKQFMSCFKEVLGQVDELKHQLVQAGTSISRQQEVNDQLTTQIKDLEHTLHIERTNKQYLLSKFNVLVNRINYQYNRQIDSNRLFRTDSNSFDKILYIKETSRVQYVDSLLYYLREILKVIYGIPVRIVCIESYYATGNVRLYPDLVPHYQLTEKDVMSGDILMLGIQPKVLQSVLRNPSSVSLLIVLDRGGYVIPHIEGDNVEYFYTVSDLKDALPNIPKSHIISYSADTLNIPVIDNFDKLDSSVKLERYSSLPIVKKLIDVIRSR